jgi:hypothetical protein
MITEKITLLDGLEYDGVIHRDIEIRPQKVRDSVEAYDDDRARENDAFLGLAVLAAQVVSFGTIPKKNVTPELLMEMSEDDMAEINKGLARLRNRVKSFRSENKNA